MDSIKKICIVASIGENCIYGAEKSISAYINSLKEINPEITIDLILKKPIFFKKSITQNGVRKIKELFNSNLDNVEQVFMPLIDLPFIESRNLRNYISFTLNLINWVFTKKKLYEKLDKYDYIHVNNCSLYYILNENLPMILHIRDICIKKSKKFIKQINKSKGIIFIDESTKSPVFDSINVDSMVINNPYSAKKVFVFNEIDDAIVENLTKNIVFSIIGRIDDERKGFEYVINEFMNTGRKDICLLIVGGTKNINANNRIHELVRLDDRIFFIGEINNIEQIYQVSDYIIRAESTFCIGRTIFEGLFNSCRLILPGKQKDMTSNLNNSKTDDFSAFTSSISYYKPRETSALQDLINSLNLVKVRNRDFYSNTEKYVDCIFRFIKSQLSYRDREL